MSERTEKTEAARVDALSDEATRGEVSDPMTASAGDGDAASKSAAAESATGDIAADETEAGKSAAAKKSSGSDAEETASETESATSGSETDPDAPKHVDSAAVSQNNTKKIVGTLVIAAVVLLICIVVFTLMGQGSSVEEVPDVAQEDTTVVVEEEPEQSLPESPVNWAEQKSINDNIYAWVSVPGTDVEQPILQHPLADNFYLRHDLYGNETIEGSVYTQKKYNTTDFTVDPVTLIYGHTFQDNNTMFSTLHNYEDPTFFEEHPYFYIYTPEYNLTYKVVSAYETDNKLILAKWDVNNLEVQQEYFDFIVNPQSWNQQIRDTERLVAGQNHVVQLSTCTKPSDGNKRYIVTGVLVNVEPVAQQEIEVSPVVEVPEEDMQ